MEAVLKAFHCCVSFYLGHMTNIKNVQILMSDSNSVLSQMNAKPKFNCSFEALNKSFSVESFFFPIRCN